MQKISDILGTMMPEPTIPAHGNELGLQYPVELEYICADCGLLVRPILVEFPKALGGSRYIKGRCSCSARRNMEEVERAKNYGRQQYFERYFSYSTLGNRFATKTFEEFEPSAGTSAALKKARQFVLTAKNAKDETERSVGILFIGPRGTGKSHLSSAIFNELRKDDKACVFINVPELLEDIRATYHANAKNSESELLDAVKKCDVLVLDDLGAERHKGEDDWATEKLFTIFDYRYRNMLPVIGTTNCQPDDLEDKIGPRIMSRIREMCDLTACLGEDFRKRKARERKNDV